MSEYFDGSLMPAAFSAGLANWSKGDGTPGSASYATDPAAAYVPADQDFAGCLELVKTQATQKLRAMAATPLKAGSYLRIRTRVKAISGNLPQVRIAGHAVNAAGGHVAGLTEVGPSVALTGYGEVVEIAAVVGIGARAGVDMVWPGAAAGHFGLDLTGGNGGVIRIDDFTIEEVGLYFVEEKLGTVDVRDYGARGDGVSDDRAAFLAADADAAGRTIVVPQGTYRLGASTTINSEIRFDGIVTLPPAARLVLPLAFNLPAYIDAFGDEMEGFRRALQALLNYNDHDSLDMCGRRVELTGPIDVQAAEGTLSSFEVRRVIRNGQLNAVAGPGWTAGQWTSSARYAKANPRKLTQVANVANIEIGSLVTGAGVGREVYVTEKNVAQQTLTLSQPLYGAAATQTYTFRRFRYMLDFSGFQKVSKFELEGLELQCNGLASGVLLAPDGMTNKIRDCSITRPKDRGITSHGIGCQDLMVDGCEFYSNEQDVGVNERSTIALNGNANDLKIRDSRFQRFRHTAILAGSGHIISGNHLFQGDGVPGSIRLAGIALSTPNSKTLIVGNYIDNCFVELGNEHDEAPEFSNEFSFGGLTITGNQFTVSNSAAWAGCIVVKPYGAGHFLHGLAVIGNVFKATGANIERVERVDSTHATLNFGLSRNVVFEGNTFNGINQVTANPAVLDFQQATAAANWVLSPGAFLPFGGWARVVPALTARGAITNAAGAANFAMPQVTPAYGDGSQVRLTFPEAVKGRVLVTVRVDNPV